MIENLLVFVVCVLTAYGAFNIVVEILDFIHNSKLKLKNSAVRIILAVKNQEEIVEYIATVARQIVQRDLPGSKIIFIDMGSSDDTFKILRKLEERYQDIEIHDRRKGEEIILDEF